MLHPVNIKTEFSINESLMVPPMLLIPLVENIFKHGADKTRDDNNAEMKLINLNGRLVFETVNTINSTDQAVKGGMGIENLRKRLSILYGKDFFLETRISNGKYFASLNIPL